MFTIEWSKIGYTVGYRKLKVQFSSRFQVFISWWVPTNRNLKKIDPAGQYALSSLKTQKVTEYIFLKLVSNYRQFSIFLICTSLVRIGPVPLSLERFYCCSVLHSFLLIHHKLSNVFKISLCHFVEQSKHHKIV